MLQIKQRKYKNSTSYTSGKEHHMTRKKIAILSLVIYMIAFYVIINKINPSRTLTVAYYEKYIVQSGDTLTSIAKQYPHGNNLNRFIYIIEDNNKITANLQIGQEILIPILEQR